MWSGDPRPVIATVLNGRKGNLGQMPTWKDKLDDQQIAAVVTYIRQAWSNRAPARHPGHGGGHEKQVIVRISSRTLEARAESRAKHFRPCPAKPFFRSLNVIYSQNNPCGQARRRYGPGCLKE